jgi:hypothetical protein
MNIYYFLLKEGELTYEKNKELYLEYADPKIRDLLETLAKSSHVMIEKYNQVIYFIPEEDNDVIGMKEMDLQRVIGYDARKIDFYLAQYLICVIIQVFYSGKGSLVKSRDFIPLSELETIITARLSFANAKKNIEQKQQETGLNITAMFEHWSALQIDEAGRRKTKYGYIRSVCGFLAKHKLLIFDADEEDIRPSSRMTNLMTYHFLDHDRLDTIEKLFKEN